MTTYDYKRMIKIISTYGLIGFTDITQLETWHYSYEYILLYSIRYINWLMTQKIFRKYER